MLLAPWIDQAILWFCGLFPEGSYPSHTFYVYPAVAIILVSLVCGAVGSLVVGNRMAFFSDALAHCAFAGVALGVLLALFGGFTLAQIRDPDAHLFITIIMVAFGIVIGLAIAFVREKTALANDTVIGVFFAGAMGLGAMLLKAVSQQGYFNLENFLFGDPGTASGQDIELLVWLFVITGVFLWFFYNDMVFASFSPSLARSRRVSTRLSQYLFIALLGILVNLSIRIVGVLLINALLIVPAATAANLSHNMRRFYRWSIIVALTVGFFGYCISLEFKIPVRGESLSFGTSGVIVVLSVLLFFASMLPWRRWFGPDANPPLHISPAEPRIVGQGEPPMAPPT